MVKYGVDLCKIMSNVHVIWIENFGLLYLMLALFVLQATAGGQWREAHLKLMYNEHLRVYYYSTFSLCSSLKHPIFKFGAVNDWFNASTLYSAVLRWWNEERKKMWPCCFHVQNVRKVWWWYMLGGFLTHWSVVCFQQPYTNTYMKWRIQLSKFK